jgi:Trk K+ transport system NAD-binding subunit
MTISDSTVAIIGAGNIGGRLAADFAAGGQDFLLAGRDQEAARKIAAGLDGHAEVVTDCAGEGRTRSGHRPPAR